MRLDLDGLEAASREALMSEWRAVVGQPVLLDKRAKASDI